MSGTSLDGVDGVLVDAGHQLRAHAHREFNPELRAELLALNEPGANELHRAALAANAVSCAYADLVATLLRKSAVATGEVRAIGAHGQTVRHRPAEFDGTGYTLQLLNGALLAELAGIDVVCDFRSRDLAAGGQGAPLVPGFHASRLAAAGHDIAVLNLGGIANLTLLSADGGVKGFDTGPANLLMDHWCMAQHGTAFDRGGAWAGQGQVDADLLRAMLSEPYFDLAPPKSTGRDLFNPSWLHRHLSESGPEVPAEDVQATLLELTASTVSSALSRVAPQTRQLIVCGGGAFNDALMARLAVCVAPTEIVRSDALGLAADQVEAAAFAWLAKAHLDRRAGNLPAVTGARGARTLGALYPA